MKIHLNLKLFIIAFFLIVTLSYTFEEAIIDAEIYNIKEFGATGRKFDKATQAIQKAIDACHVNGGGTVYVPSGEYTSGTIELLSNVNLCLEAGAVLKGSLDTTDYLVDGKLRGLIIAEKVKNISITGLGEINGNGTAFMNLDKPHIASDFDRNYTRQGEDYMSSKYGFEDGPVAYDYRPGMMVVILKCENVLIENVTFRDSPSWTIRLGDCDNVDVINIDILNNLLIPNSDGIHCTTSRNVRISGCDIRAGDDAVIVTGFGDEISVHGKEREIDHDYTKRKIGNKTGYAENVTVTNCSITSRSSGIRVGYGDNSIKNCIFQNLVIYSSNRGLGIFVRDKGSIENIVFSDILIETRLHSGHWWGNGEPIHVSAIPQNENIDIGEIKNIQFSNIIAKSEAGILVYGVKESIVQDLCFNNIQLSITDSPLSQSYGGNFDLRPTKSMETSIFKHDLPGMFCRYVHGLRIKDFELKFAQNLPDYFSHGIHCEYFEDLEIDGLEARQALIGKKGATISLQNGKNVTIRHCKALDGTGIFLLHSALEDERLFVNNDLSRAKAAMQPEKTFFEMYGNYMPIK